MRAESSDYSGDLASQPTRGKAGLSLLLRYWGVEWGSRRFVIYVDDQQLATIDNTGKWNQSQFFHVEYPIPDAMVAKKSFIRVKFKGLPGGSAGPGYDIRLLEHGVGPNLLPE